MRSDTLPALPWVATGEAIGELEFDAERVDDPVFDGLVGASAAGPARSENRGIAYAAVMTPAVDERHSPSIPKGG